MERAKLQELLTLLKTDEYRTAAQLSRLLGVSEKTVRLGIHELNDQSQVHGAEVTSKARYGYRLNILDPEKLQTYQRNFEESQRVPENAQERSEYLLVYLLQRQDYVKLEELCDFIYVSKTTLSACLKTVEATLRRYNLSIERRPNYGLKVQGEETGIRHLLSDHFIKRHSLRDVDISHQQAEVSWLAAQVQRLLTKYDVHLSEMAFENFVNYAYVACKRMRGGFFLNMPKENRMELGIKEQAFLEELLVKLEDQYDIDIPPDEEQYLLLYLAGKRMIGNVVENDSNFIIHEETDRLAVEMLKLVGREYHIEFQNNFEMRMTLNQHLVPFDVRIRYDIPLKNPILEEIKKKYSLAYQMAIVGGKVLRDHYQKEISEDELGYFALIFQLALEKWQTPGHSSILVVCSTGKGTSRLLKFKYEQEFADFLKDIYVCDLLGLETFDLTKIDYIFTTVPITRKVNVPIVEVGMFLGEDDIRRVTEVLKFGSNEDIIRRYYGPERFFSHVKTESKEETLRWLCDIIGKQEQVDDNFYELVLERETYVQMDYGNLIALPHPNQIASEESFAYVAVLEEPIEWNNLKVQVVILISIGRSADKEKERQRFYETTARFALSEEAVSRLLENPEYENLARLLQE